MAQTIPAPPVVPGYAYAIRLEIEGEDTPFPAGCELRADVRRFVYSGVRIARLTTEDEGIVRIDDNTVEIRMSEADTSAIDGGSVVLDLVRTDVEPVAYLYVQVRLPVTKPVTRGAA